MNLIRTAILLAAMTALFMAVGYWIGGGGGMVFAFLFAAGVNLFAYWNSDKMVLRIHHARAVDRAGAPLLVDTVTKLCLRAQMPMPKVYVIDTPQPNAFATGRNPEHAAVAATTGLLNLLNRDELEGVIAHELAHIRHHDTLTMTITATLAGAISMLAHMAFFVGRRDRGGMLTGLIVMLLAPLAAAMVQMAISRGREYEADRGGAEISGKPLALATALQKLQHGAARFANPVAEANPATAHLFIVNPLHGEGADNLFSTHPAPANRIARLRELAIAMGQRSPAPSRRRGPWG